MQQRITMFVGTAMWAIALNIAANFLTEPAQENLGAFGEAVTSRYFALVSFIALLAVWGTLWLWGDRVPRQAEGKARTPERSLKESLLAEFWRQKWAIQDAPVPEKQFRFQATPPRVQGIRTVAVTVSRPMEDLNAIELQAAIALLRPETVAKFNAFSDVERNAMRSDVQQYILSREGTEFLEINHGTIYSSAESY